MNKKLISMLAGAMLLACPLAIVVTQPGCTTTQNRITYQTLYGIGLATSKSYQAYNDLVVAGKIPASTLEPMCKIWDKYRVAYIAAVDVAKTNLNAPAPQDVIDLSNSLIAAIAVLTK